MSLRPQYMCHSVLPIFFTAWDAGSSALFPALNMSKLNRGTFRLLCCIAWNLHIALAEFRAIRSNNYNYFGRNVHISWPKRPYFLAETSMFLGRNVPENVDVSAKMYGRNGSWPKCPVTKRLRVWDGDQTSSSNGVLLVIITDVLMVKRLRVWDGGQTSSSNGCFGNVSEIWYSYLPI